MRVALVIVGGVLFAFVAYYFQATYTMSATCSVAHTWSACGEEILVREALHVLGALGIIILLRALRPLISKPFLIGVTLIIVLYFSVQEFYLHPFIFGQPLMKGTLDFLAWGIPLMLYALLEWRHEKE